MKQSGRQGRMPPTRSITPELGIVVVKKALAVLALVLVGTSLFALCLISAIQLLKPHDMPFGVTGSSPLVKAVQAEASKKNASIDLLRYASEADLIEAAERGDLYGGFIPGRSADTLVTVPAQSFFGEIYVRGAFTDAAKKAKRSITTKTIAPLPTSDRTGAVVGLLLLPTLLGGYLIAAVLFAFTQRAAVQGRIAIILGFSVAVALITGAVAAVTGAVAVSDVWPLLPCFALVTAAVALAGTAIQAFARGMGTLLIGLFFIVIGGAGAGGVGVSLLPGYWQTIGALFPPRHAVDLFRNVHYFAAHNIVTPIAVLSAYALVGAAVIVLVTRRRGAAGGAEAVSATRSRRLVPKNLIAPIGLAVLLTTLFAVNYTTSGHEPIATDMPFGVVGSSPLPSRAQGPLFSLDVTDYPTQAAATEAMNEGKSYGTLIVGSPGSASQLTVVNSISDLSPLDIAGNFEEAAKKSGETLTVNKPYAPTALARNDPFALVCSALLVPLLVGGYMAAALLPKARGAVTGHWHGVWLLGGAAATGLVVDVIVTYWLDGLPSASFWIVWPILTLIIATVSLLAAVLRRVAGPVGIFLTVILVIQFGNPSSGGANGVPYLPAFWKDLGPLLPPRNAYLLLRDTVYFDGHGIGQPLTILLAYLVVAAIVLTVFDWFIDKPSLSVPGIDDETDEVVLAPVGPPP
jgi:hypothetical protein